MNFGLQRVNAGALSFSHPRLLFRIDSQTPGYRPKWQFVETYSSLFKILLSYCRKHVHVSLNNILNKLLICSF
jgi:hypothetical protein